MAIAHHCLRQCTAWSSYRANQSRLSPLPSGARVHNGRESAVETTFANATGGALRATRRARVMIGHRLCGPCCFRALSARPLVRRRVLTRRPNARPLHTGVRQSLVLRRCLRRARLCARYGDRMGTVQGPSGEDGRSCTEGRMDIVPRESAPA